jgi:hypothetical protein
MPVGARFCVTRAKIVPGFDGKAIEVHDSEFEASYHPTRKVAAAVHRELTMNANHPVYGLDDLLEIDDDEVSEWLYETDQLINIENHEAWFECLSDDEKTLYRVAFMNAKPSAKRLNLEKMIGMELPVLASVAAMAESHVEDILSGLEDGTYDKEENEDIDCKVETLGKLQAFIAANL